MYRRLINSYRAIKPDIQEVVVVFSQTMVVRGTHRIFLRSKDMIPLA